MAIQANDIERLHVRIHHVGLLVKNIESYMASSFWLLRSQIVYDPIQKSQLCLVCLADDDNHLVELIEPVGEDSPAHRALMKGQKQHHLCLEAPSTGVADSFIQKYHLLPVTKWQPAKLFQGRPIRFVYTQYRELMEFIADE